MSEPEALSTARRHLAQAESVLATADGLAHLREGLALIERVVDDHRGTASERVARNLGSTYAAKVHRTIGRALERDASLPEPLLEHFFAVVRAFDEACVEPPAAARAIKIDLVRRLIDCYCEGFDPIEKRKAHEQLERLVGLRQ